MVFEKSGTFIPWPENGELSKASWDPEGTQKPSPPRRSLRLQDPCSEVYIGPGPFSEPETEARGSAAKSETSICLRI